MTARKLWPELYHEEPYDVGLDPKEHNARQNKGQNIGDRLFLDAILESKAVNEPQARRALLRAACASLRIKLMKKEKVQCSDDPGCEAAKSKPKTNARLDGREEALFVCLKLLLIDQPLARTLVEDPNFFALLQVSCQF